MLTTCQVTWLKGIEAWWPSGTLYPFCFGSGFPYKVTKKSALMIILSLGYHGGQGLGCDRSFDFDIVTC